MKNYIVQMPFAGVVCLTVEAENKEEAKEKFYEEVKEKELYSIVDFADNVEWDFYEKMVDGNVCHIWNHTLEITEE